MAEPNHELTDSEAQAFQAEPHLQHLLKRLQPGSAVPPGSRRPAGQSTEPRELEESRPERSPRRDRA